MLFRSHSLYEKYFHAKVIDKALKSSEYTSLDWDSYIFRILNLTNKNSDLDALPGLRDIRSIIFSSVKNLKSTEDAFSIALKVYDVLLNNFDVNVVNPQEENKEGQDERKVWCILADTDCVCLPPTTCVGTQCQFFCLDTRCGKLSNTF